MYAEALCTLVFTTLACLALMLLDTAVSAVLAPVVGLPFRKLFCWGLLSLLLPPLLIAWGAFAGRNHVKVKEITLCYKELPAEFDGYRIAQLSDIHSRSFEGRTRVLEKFVQKANGTGADLIAFTGDVITLTPEELDATAPVLSRLTARDGVVSVLGNHDYGIYMYPRSGGLTRRECIAEVARREREMGWQILLDENVTVSRGDAAIAVIGVENTTPSPHFESSGDLTEASKGTEGMFRVLLSHDPMHWDMEVTGHDYPLMLSGHTHAMQLSLLGWCPSRYMFRQYRGLYRNGDQALYVNAGLGETIFPARIGVPPEITVITLRKKD